MQGILRALRTQPAAAEFITDQEQIKSGYRYWRVRIMYSMMTGYAVYYFVRKNLSIAIPEISKEFGFSNTDIGLILSASTVVYAFSKFFSGVLADRANPRYFMALGLIMCALVNVLFGMSSTLIVFICLWALNNAFQGMGMAPCSKLIGVWFSSAERGRAFGVWNASHQIGGTGILILSGFLVSHFGWRYAFFVPAAIAAIATLFIVNRLRDTPASLGYPPVEGVGDKKKAEPEDSAVEIFVNYILRNKMVWIIAFSNIFVYIVRTGVFDWAPKFLKESRGFSSQQAANATAAFEIAGLFGAFAAGYISDKWMNGRRMAVALIFMVFLAASIVGLIMIPSGFVPLTALMTAIGFFVYGPQVLVAIAAVDFASAKAGAAAVGLTGLFGYLGATLCGVGTGYIVDHYGWNGGLLFYLSSAIIGCVLFLLIGHKKPNQAV